MFKYGSRAHYTDYNFPFLGFATSQSWNKGVEGALAVDCDWPKATRPPWFQLAQGGSETFFVGPLVKSRDHSFLPTSCAVCSVLALFTEERSLQTPLASRFALQKLNSPIDRIKPAACPASDGRPITTGWFKFTGFGDEFCRNATTIRACVKEDFDTNAASATASEQQPSQLTQASTGGYDGQYRCPIRHPRPLTAAELHLELEKEQESIVNRLTRELSALRAQTASVASTTSSTSEQLFANDPYNTTTTGTTIIPTNTRRHRSSSNLSTRSARSIRESLSNAANTSVSGVAAPRDQSVQASARPSMEMSRPDMSRQNSTSATGFRSSSITSSPHLTQGGYAYPHRSSVSSTIDGSSGVSHAAMTRSPSSNAAIAQARYEEAALQRAELEAVKRENEALRARVKELEKSLQKANEQTQSTNTA
ncbi:hypothetical protein AYO21_07124 [Fonsecaea monophora]|uniref:Uncharacterized protein n=1 Tax=Fonsecaea monophora TaxID=254056 RepID=A0A177F301_9EURO|nr:hypothetical protein AYO21_07124 [Fonsecaea monophora]OAG38618.1 hypothetical protein AYO21_07124 [Fonsecaea monophora]